MVLSASAVDIDIVARLDGRGEQLCQIETVRLPVVDRSRRIEAIGATDHFVDRAKSQLRHDLSGFLGNQSQIIDHILRFARKSGPQLRILSRNPDRAGIQVALPHHDTPESNERCGAETKLFGTQHGGQHDIATGLEAAIGLQHHATPQIVHHQRLVGLRNSQFPGQPRMFDAGQRRGPRATCCAGNQNVIGKTLRDARSDGSHPHFRHQFDTDAGIRVGIFQIVNQLFEILDGVDVVMGRRADQTDAGCGVTDTSNIFIDLTTRQFTPLTRFCPLRNLDLDLVGIGQIKNGHSKSPRGNLFDRRSPGIPIGQRLEPHRILTPLAGVAFATESVHRNGEGLMGLGGDGTETHRTGAKTLDDFADRLHLIERNRIGRRLELNEAPQGVLGLCLVVEPLGKLPVGIATIGPRGNLQIGNHMGRPGVPLSFCPPMELARVGQ